MDLRARARQAMVEAGFVPDLPPGVVREVRALEDAEETTLSDGAVRDLSALLWSSIDNDTSRDLDQIEFAQKGNDGRIRLLIGIADVDASVPKGSATDHHAAHNTTSVYTGVETFPMLPEPLSTDATSLLEDQDRLAVVVDFTVGPDGAVSAGTVYRARTRNCAKLDYESVGAWLEENGPVPPEVASLPGLDDQIRLQYEAGTRLQALRRRNGALHFETIEATPIAVGGKVVDLAVKEKNRARYLIETFMVAANTLVSSFLRSHGSLAIQRVVRTPKRWDRIVQIAEQRGERLPEEANARALADFLNRRRQADPDHFPDLSLAVVKLLGAGEYAVVGDGDATPEGHFGLAVQGYTHSTAPNRRYADLVTQRLLKAVIANQPAPYSQADLAAIAQRCTERGSAATKVERLMRKVAAAELLGDRLGDVFSAFVTGASPKGTYVRLLAPPAEGRVVRGEDHLDVGDKVRVRLIAVDPGKGFLDFETVT